MKEEACPESPLFVWVYTVEMEELDQLLFRFENRRMGRTRPRLLQISSAMGKRLLEELFLTRTSVGTPTGENYYQGYRLEIKAEVPDHEIWFIFPKWDY